MKVIQNPYDTSHYSWTSWVSYRLLEDDLIKNMQYIPPDDKNLKTWSPQLSNLLIIICTRLDSFFKASIRSNIWSVIEPTISNFPKDQFEVIKDKLKKKKLNISDYLAFFDPLFDLNSLDVFFKPRNLAVISPFKNWQEQKVPSWWSIYNKLKHDYYSNMTAACLDCVIDAFAAYMIFYLIYPESLSTLVYNKGVLKTARNLPGGILDNKKTQVLIQKTKKMEQEDPSDPKILKMKRKLNSWKNTIPPYPFLGRDDKIIAESKLFLFFYRTPSYNWLKERMDVDPQNYLHFPNHDPSPV